MTDVTLAKTTAKKPVAQKAVEAASKPFRSVDDIRLGMVVKDPASGLTGIVNMQAQLISGSVQYAIMPQGDGKTIPETHFIDDFMLEYVGEGVSKRTPAPDINARHRLGEELQDTITGFKGIAIERVTYLNGCVHYNLQPQQKKAGLLGRLFGEPPRSAIYDYKRLKKVSDGIADKVAKIPKAGPKPEEPKAFKRSTTGGPTRSAHSYSQR